QFGCLAFLECGDPSPLWLVWHLWRGALPCWVFLPPSRCDIGDTPCTEAVTQAKAAKDRRTPKKPNSQTDKVVLRAGKRKASGAASARQCEEGKQFPTELRYTDGMHGFSRRRQK